MNDEQMIWESYNKELAKQYLVDHGFVDNNGNTPEINPDGTISLYHNTKSEEIADQIKTSRTWLSKEHNQIFFSTKPNEQTTGYGEITLKVNVKPNLMNLDDIFDNEIHVWVDSRKLKGLMVQSV
jgi:hypothetical protein